MEANKPCRQSFNCKFPFCKFIHPCRYGVLCRKSMGSDPLHFSKYSHPKQCPSGIDCKIDDHVHIWEFSHVCKYHVNGGCKKMDDNFHSRRFIHPKPPLLRQTFPINSHTYFEEQAEEEDDEEEEIVNEVESENEDEDENENENESENFLEGENEDSSLFDVPITDVLLTRSSSSATSSLSSPQNLPRRHLFFDDDDEGRTISPLSTRSPSPTPNAFQSSSTSSTRTLIFTDQSEESVINAKTPTSTANCSDKSSQGQTTESFRECKICLDNDIEVALVPCGHALACASCAKSLKKCPMCCALFTTTIRIFLS